VHNIVCLMWVPYHCDVPRNEIVAARNLSGIIGPRRHKLQMTA